MYWTPGPDFVQGQTMSALAHLNPLTDAINFLAGVEVGPRFPFVGDEIFYNKGTIWRYSEYVIRHESNLFEYEYELTGGTARITIDGTLVPGSENTAVAKTNYSATVDISSIGLTIGERYHVRFEVTDGAGSVGRLWLMREVTTPSYTTLAAFTDGLTPTAAEWQALSTVANEIHSVQTAPHASFCGNRIRRDAPTLWTGRWIGTFRHTARYLTYHMWLRPPYWGSEAVNTEQFFDLEGVRIGEEPVDGGEHWVQARFYVDDVEAVTPTLIVTDEATAFTDVFWHEYDGTIDLSALGLSYGQDYKVRVDFVSSSSEWYAGGRLESLIEAPGATPSLPGWQALDQWAHADEVLGDSGSLNIVKMRTDLEILKTLAKYENYPTPHGRYVLGGEGNVPLDDMPDQSTLERDVILMWGQRRHKWLHYCTKKTDSPTLTLWQEPDADDPNVQTTTLTASYGDTDKPEGAPDNWDELALDWQLLDLDSVKGCFLGSIYALKGVLYAFEDDSPPNV